MDKIKVLVADDHQVIIDGLEAIISDVPELEFVGGALNGNQVIEMVESKAVDMVLMDINMPEMDGLECTSYLSKHYPQIRIIALSMHDNPRLAKRMIKNGAFGFLLKNSSKENILKAIFEVKEGRNFFDPLLMQNFLDVSNQKNSSSFAKKDLLTKRELEIIQLICQEKTTGEIADELSISTHTVESHRSNILLKLELKNSVGLVKWAIQNEVIEL
ncbi:response regulator [Roseivirga pacifica]|uniref:response regulator n=1 Tax=Roseivirga pacifica TaxID=1267423 RepID=UPI0020964C02|nr:response regulator transcription factor [Roseivirga pacifica]MCO6360014.1 response regulator [Roseivirga pacifica]MCO6367384.1 response regulator [Roseivirga pacifica]MCO6370085.1 response regulator [Roseivirga pacifica]MCO6375041.1 response regulator [Roseivirga pacifica]MCO6380299.1 response regulator [Roseivirga pacifica]